MISNEVIKPSFCLSDDVVDVWSVSKTAHERRLQDYWFLLNKDEQDRAQRFRFVKDRNCFIIARGVLRHLISKYIEISPKNIVFQFGTNGKPFVDHKSIEFNVSHSHDSIVYGFTQSHILGVDVEYIKRPINVIEVAQSFFSKKEVNALLKLDEPQHIQAFYNCWTRKEAFIKAEGSGLSFPLKEFSVSLDSKTYTELLETRWDQKEKEKWTLKAFVPNQDYIGAVAIKRKIEKFNYYTY